MIYPATTAFFAALLALLYLALSVWVVAGRVSTETLHGSGGDPLLKRIRSHANFQEYVPLTLILVGLLEARGASHALVETLLAVLLVARILHPIGMFAPPNSPRQFACRGGGIIASLAVLAIAAISLLLRVA